MMGALVSAISRRWFLRLAVAVFGTVAVVGSWMLLPVAWWAALWSLLCIAAVVLASLHDTGDRGEDR